MMLTISGNCEFFVSSFLYFKQRPNYYEIEPGMLRHCIFFTLPCFALPNLLVCVIILDTFMP